MNAILSVEPGLISDYAGDRCYMFIVHARGAMRANETTAFFFFFPLFFFFTSINIPALQSCSLQAGAIRWPFFGVSLVFCLHLHPRCCTPLPPSALPSLRTSSSLAIHLNSLPYTSAIYSSSSPSLSCSTCPHSHFAHGYLFRCRKSAPLPPSTPLLPPPHTASPSWRL